MNVRRWLIRIGLSVFLLLVVGTLAFVGWGNNPAPALPEALVALQNDETLTITDNADLISFIPKHAPTTGLIFYPGARVTPAAYAPYMRSIAQAGYAVYIVKMPLNFAIFGIDRGQAIIKDHPNITSWVIAGHSLGGSMAAQAVANSPQSFQGLIFWASYAATDLSKTGVRVLSIFGSEDGLVKQAIAKDAEKYLPVSARSVVIQGGNHAYFGFYGAQDGDQPATVSQQQVGAQIVSETIAFLQTIGQPVNVQPYV